MSVDARMNSRLKNKIFTEVTFLARHISYCYISSMKYCIVLNLASQCAALSQAASWCTFENSSKARSKQELLSE